MTDTYGTPPHDNESGHDEILTPEHEAVHEAPSDYEFADEQAAASEEHSDEHDGVSDASPPARRSVLLPIAAAVGGVLLLVAVAWWQFGSSAPTITVTAMPTIAPAVALNTPTQAVDTSLAVAPRTAASAPVEIPMPAPVQAVEQAVQQAPAPVASVPTVEIKSVPLMPAPVAAPAPNDDEQRIAALNARIDSLQKSLEQANQQLNQMANMVAAGGVSSGVSVDAFPAKPVVHQTPVKHAVVRKAVAKKAPVVSKTVVVEGTPNWVLRSAAPGIAWVSANATSHDLKEVHVGDSLAGIGKVTAIRQQGMGWVVEGSKGQIQ